MGEVNCQNGESCTKIVHTRTAAMNSSASIVSITSGDLESQPGCTWIPLPIIVSTVNSCHMQNSNCSITVGDMIALALYQCASQLQPQVYEYWWHQGLVLFHLHRFTEAIAAYDQTGLGKFAEADRKYLQEQILYGDLDNALMDVVEVFIAPMLLMAAVVDDLIMFHVVCKHKKSTK